MTIKNESTTRTRGNTNIKRNENTDMKNQGIKSVLMKMQANPIQFGSKKLNLSLRKPLDFTKNLIWPIECMTHSIG